MTYSLEDLLEFLPDMLGICGVILVLWYYFLLQIGKCRSDSLAFSLGNLVGSILLLISLWFNWNISSVIIEIAWLVISFYGIYKYCTRFQTIEPEAAVEPE